MNRYRFVEDRIRFLIARGMVRTALSTCCDISPKEWVFAYNEYGRPRVATPRLDDVLDFNVSHSGDVIACAVVSASRVGLDVENTRRLENPLEIASRFFSESERVDLHRLPPDRQRTRFFEYWTLKEAYLKARGVGLSMPLDQVSFEVDETSSCIKAFDPSMAGSEWQFELFQPDLEHMLALAIDRSRKAQHRVKMILEPPVAPSGL